MNLKAMNILFVDDDEVVAQSVEMALRANGHACEIAGLGQRAVALCKANDYDIAVVDVGLPDMDGFHVARLLKIEGVETPLLLQTGLNDPELPANAESLGIEAFLTKPFSIADLLDRMEEVLARPSIEGPACELQAPGTLTRVAEPAPRPAASAASAPAQTASAADRRRHERKPIVEAAVISDRESHIPCVIINLSENGAGLRLADAEMDCSEIFTLHPLNSPVRRCTQRWRNGDMIGVEFT